MELFSKPNCSNSSFCRFARDSRPCTQRLSYATWISSSRMCWSVRKGLWSYATLEWFSQPRINWSSLRGHRHIWHQRCSIRMLTRPTRASRPISTVWVSCFGLCTLACTLSLAVNQVTDTMLSFNATRQRSGASIQQSRNRLVWSSMKTSRI